MQCILTLRPYNVGSDPSSPSCLPVLVSLQSLFFRNVAKGCSAFQSSTYHHYSGYLVAGKAVDGICSGDLNQDNSCSHTNADPEPWWYVDLEEEHTVSAIVVRNRQDCCPERLRDAQVRVGNYIGANSKKNHLCGTIQDISPGSTSTIQCGGQVGQYVSINLPRSDFLTVCELEVYAMKVVCA
nr:PREDICTED: fucolectin-1-like [Anolis carolinensis]|eukprot:XP_008100962.1 PREDICTED: fucolectin-1-like [Anolis carolinensis]